MDKKFKIGFIGNLNDSSFPYSVSYLTLLQAEEKCPFCKHELIYGRCTCTQFQRAFEKFMCSYPNKAFISGNTSETRMYETLFLNDTNFFIEKLSPAKIDLFSFVDGTAIHKKGLWEISLAAYKEDKRELSFLIRKVSTNIVYQCVVTGFIPHLSLPDIRICKSEELLDASKILSQNLHVRKLIEIERFNYFDFINKIKENS